MKKIHDAVLAYAKGRHSTRGIYATTDGEFILKCDTYEAADKSGLKFVFKLDGSELTLI